MWDSVRIYDVWNCNYLQQNWFGPLPDTSKRVIFFNEVCQSNFSDTIFRTCCIDVYMYVCMHISPLYGNKNAFYPVVLCWYDGSDNIYCRRMPPPAEISPFRKTPNNLYPAYSYDLCMYLAADHIALDRGQDWPGPWCWLMLLIHFFFTALNAHIWIIDALVTYICIK